MRTAADAQWVAERSPSLGCLGASDSPRELGELIRQRTRQYKHALK